MEACTIGEAVLTGHVLATTVCGGLGFLLEVAVSRDAGELRRTSATLFGLALRLELLALEAASKLSLVLISFARDRLLTLRCSRVWSRCLVLLQHFIRCGIQRPRW